MSDKTLWCVHVMGPDELYAAPDVITAVKWAHACNVHVAKQGEHDFDDDRFVLCYANVDCWPYEAELHAKDLPRSIEMMTPRSTRALTDQG